MRVQYRHHRPRPITDPIRVNGSCLGQEHFTWPPDDHLLTVYVLTGVLIYCPEAKRKEELCCGFWSVIWRMLKCQNGKWMVKIVKIWSGEWLNKSSWKSLSCPKIIFGIGSTIFISVSLNRCKSDFWWLSWRTYHIIGKV